MGDALDDDMSIGTGVTIVFVSDTGRVGIAGTGVWAKPTCDACGAGNADGGPVGEEGIVLTVGGGTGIGGGGTPGPGNDPGKLMLGAGGPG